MPSARQIYIGVVIGLAIYVVEFYGFTAISPWFAEARNWVSIFSHIAFSVALTWACKAFFDTR